MRKLAVGIISALAGGTMLMSGGVATASTTTTADPEVEIVDISPNPVEVEWRGETTANFKVNATSDVEKVELTVSPATRNARTMAAKEVKPLEDWRFSVPFNSRDYEGKWRATAVAFDKDGKRVAEDSSFFSVDVQKRRSKDDTRIIGFEASPSKTFKGRTVRFSGRLLVEDGRRWDTLSHANVSIYYRANGSSGWKWVDSDRTDRRGKFDASTRAWKSGSYKAVYKGSWRTDDTSSRSDYVRVYSWRR
ncbi:hypothetical protein ACTMTF_13690 [Nonomuraea sp. ZG12]|uniref:hypothetical protein n=1 Tax=Nonomuraea sp. ZG12 TaxID=3452207 RepID=UPI003F88F058